MPVTHYFLMLRPVQVIEKLNEFLSVEGPAIVNAQCYPNPFSDKIHIGIESEEFAASEVVIYDLMGRKVFAQPCCLNTGYNEIELCPHLNSGVYFVKLGGLKLKIVRQ